MSAAERDDIAAWQAGALSAAELQARHPGPEVASALAAHAALVDLAGGPVPDAAQAWSRLAAALPAQPTISGPRRFRRPVVAAIVATLLAGPAVSYAAAPHAVRSGIRHVTDLFTDRHDEEPRPADPVTVDDSQSPSDDPAVEIHPTDPAPPAGEPDTRSNDGTERESSVDAPASDHDEPSDDTSPTADGDSPDADQPDAPAPTGGDDDRGAPSPEVDGAEQPGGSIDPSFADARPGD